MHLNFTTSLLGLILAANTLGIMQTDHFIMQDNPDPNPPSVWLTGSEKPSRPLHYQDHYNPDPCGGRPARPKPAPYGRVR